MDFEYIVEYYRYYLENWLADWWPEHVGKMSVTEAAELYGVQALQKMFDDEVQLNIIIKYYEDFLRQWLQGRWPQHVGLLTLTEIADLYGPKELTSKFDKEMDENISALLADGEFQEGGGRQENGDTETVEVEEEEPVVSEGEVPEEVIEWANYFALRKDGEKKTKKFSLTQFTYSVQIAALPLQFDPVTSILAMPHILAAVFKVCVKDFQPDDRMVITLVSDTLTAPIFLSMRKFSDFNIDALMQKIELLNSQKKFCINDSFQILIERTILPTGGKKRIHIHNSIDRKRHSRSIVQVWVEQDLCLPACLVLGRFRLEHDIKGAHKSAWGHLCNKRKPKLERLAKELVQEADLSFGWPFGLDDLEKFQKRALQGYQLKVVSVDDGNVVVARIPEKKKKGMKEIYLLHEKGHFDLITKPSGFHRRSYYCHDCDKPFTKKAGHRCGGFCTRCYRPKEECTETDQKLCDDCGRTFNNQDCFDIHKATRKNGATYCSQLFVCPNCRNFVSMLNRTGKEHKCEEMFCRTCRDWVPQSTHRCHIQPLEPKTYPEVPKHIYFDYETYLDSDGVHKPCYVVAQLPDGQEFRFPPDGTPMAGYDASTEFGKWVFSEQHRGYTIIAHNFRGYDGHFLLAYMLENNLKGIDVIRRGTQLLDIRYAALEINARDTLNFVATKLCNFPKAVGLDNDVQKGDFPHRLNHPCNWDKVLPFPELDMYTVEGLSKDERKAFTDWHSVEKQKGNFDFRQEISKYCSNDVGVLRKCALKFRQNFLDQTMIDPFESVTVASACQKYYRTYLLKANEIAVISTNGYQANRKTSLQSTQWLEWLNMSTPIEHGRNGKEKRFGNYFVDGYDAATQTIYEYNGCVHHGHPECTEEEDRTPFSNKKMKEVYEEWTDKKRYLEERGFTVESKWSCEWEKERKNPDIKQFLLNMNLRDPLCPREAFKGGRTNAASLRYSVKEGERILHFDIVSLYPYVNKTAEYPIGHPEIIVANFGPIEQYHGFVHCKIQPPTNLRFPVLPATVTGKLLFTLCNQCAIDKVNDYCTHSEAERCLTGTWCTPELHHALTRGYKVVEVYEVWHWQERRKGLFAQYVDKFLKEKLEASGWPARCTTRDSKDAHLLQIKEKEGIELDAGKVEDNPARRGVAKLMLNSFWGKFGQRDNLQQTSFIHSPKKYFDLCRSQATEIHSVHAVTPECLMVTTSKREEYNEGNNAVNLAIAAFTTSVARLKLLDTMERLGKRLLYYDTDSVIFVQRHGDWLPDTGSYLGEWSEELANGETHITEFVSCGPKVYSYCTNTGRYELKVKGFTQNGYTENILDLDLNLTNKKLDFGSLEEILDGDVLQVVYPAYFKKNGKTQEITTVKMAKRLQKVYDKRILMDNLSTKPFGTKRRNRV